MPTTAAKLRDDHVSWLKGQCPQHQQRSEMILSIHNLVAEPGSVVTNLGSDATNVT